MTQINGPYITKTVVVPERTVNVLDEDAYWHLNWEGDDDPEEGTFLYARVAWPRLADAQRQHGLHRTALDAERAARPKRADRRRQTKDTT